MKCCALSILLLGVGCGNAGGGGESTINDSIEDDALYHSPSEGELSLLIREGTEVLLPNRPVDESGHTTSNVTRRAPKSRLGQLLGIICHQTTTATPPPAEPPVDITPADPSILDLSQLQYTSLGFSTYLLAFELGFYDMLETLILPQGASLSSAAFEKIFRTAPNLRTLQYETNQPIDIDTIRVFAESNLTSLRLGAPQLTDQYVANLVRAGSSGLQQLVLHGPLTIDLLREILNSQHTQSLIHIRIESYAPARRGFRLVDQDLTPAPLTRRLQHVYDCLPVYQTDPRVFHETFTEWYARKTNEMRTLTQRWLNEMARLSQPRLAAQAVH